MIGYDPYYSRAEVSNSDLGDLEKYFLPGQQKYDIETAYRFGNLIDAMITEPHRVDHYNLRVDGEQFTNMEWELAYRMLESWRKDPFCQKLRQVCNGQAVHDKILQMDHEGIQFEIHARCKYDLWCEELRYGADIKSTTATTQRQFEQAIDYFQYDRQRAWYMDITGADKDILIGISKKNGQIFKVFITRESPLYKTGQEKYRRLAFRWWYLHDKFFTKNQ